MCNCHYLILEKEESSKSLSYDTLFILLSDLFLTDFLFSKGSAKELIYEGNSL